MHMFEMRQLHWYHMQGRWVYTIKSCRSLPESFSHIIFPCQAMSSHVKPCQFAQEGNLRVVHMLLQQKALPSGFHWGSKGTRRPRKIIRELMGTHRNSWEAWSRANLLHSVESASFLPWRYCIQFRPTFEATLTLSDSFVRMEGFMVCMSKKNEIQIDTILSCHANHFLSTIQMLHSTCTWGGSPAKDFSWSDSIGCGKGPVVGRWSMGPWKSMEQVPNLVQRWYFTGSAHVAPM